MQRILQLMRNDILLNKKLMFLSTIGALLFLLVFPFQVSSSYSGYYLILYVGGLLVTSHAFSDLHDAQRNPLYVMLPCSNIEKVFSKWLLTSIIYAIATLAAYYLVSIIANIVISMVQHTPFTMLNLFDTYLWEMMGRYCLIQTLFFLGAVTFRRHSLIKTLFVLMTALFVFSVIAFTAGWITCLGCVFEPFIFNSIYTGLNLVFWLILPPLCLVVAYYKFTEYELR